ncbi:NrpR regulatory domain-containing protein [Methanogenium cariaci]|jgi:global nitrogen regulator NrpRII
MKHLKFVNHRIDEYALQVTYDPATDSGKVIFNLTLIKEEDRGYAVDIIHQSHKAGICVSDRMLIADAGEKIGDKTIPKGYCGMVTMCSITLDAILLRNGIPINPIGGGLLEINDHVPRRFTSLIRYDATTIDPTQVMIDQGSTGISGVIQSGNGSILANIRESHMEAEPLLYEILDQFGTVGFTGILDVGSPNRSLFGVPVTTNYQGVVMIGGANPVAAFIESGRWAETTAMKGLIPVSRLVHIDDIE